MTTAATRMSTRREATLTSLVGDGRPDARTDSAGSIGTRGQLLKPDQPGISRRSERMSRSTHTGVRGPQNRTNPPDRDGFGALLGRSRASPGAKRMRNPLPLAPALDPGR